jgi:hypothetical protein
MRRIGTTMGVWLATAIATSGLGCATITGGASKEDARKATSHVQVGGDHLANGRSALALREFLAAEKLDPKNAQVQLRACRRLSRTRQTRRVRAAPCAARSSCSPTTTTRGSSSPRCS